MFQNSLSGIFGQRSRFPASHTGEISINLCVISLPQKMRFPYMNANKGTKGTPWRDATEHRIHVLTRMRHLLLLGTAPEKLRARCCATAPARRGRTPRGRAGSPPRGGRRTPRGRGPEASAKRRRRKDTSSEGRACTKVEGARSGGCEVRRKKKTNPHTWTAGKK